MEQVETIQKESNELRSNLREVEKARLEARRELQDLRRQVKMLDSERSKLGKEVTDLQMRVARDEEKEEESRRHAFDLKQKVRGERFIFKTWVLFIWMDRQQDSFDFSRGGPINWNNRRLVGKIQIPTN